jgi:PleD family two-component response regulator
VTGFDNHLRMKLELSEEIKRAERYGNSFVFLLLHMYYFKEFKSLYGEKETPVDGDKARNLFTQLFH